MRTIKNRSPKWAYKITATTSVVAVMVLSFYVYSVALGYYGAKSVSLVCAQPQNSENKSVIERIHALKLKNEGVILNLAKCESTMREFAVNYNIKDKSYDRGVLQINAKWHPEVSDECAFDVECSAKWTDERITNGYLHEWACSRKI